jgi:hypothetical protein
MQPLEQPSFRALKKPGRDSQTFRIARPRSFSHDLWGIDWQSLLPITLADDGLVAEYSNFEACTPFIAANYASIFDEQPGASAFSNNRPHPAKARYYELTGDFIKFSLGGEPIGLFVGMPSDWSSYYVRSAAMLPEHQGRHAPQAFFRALFPVLAKHGVERVELDVSPANAAMMHIVTRLRFNATGTTLSERWGALIHFTKFLADDCEDIFMKQFCGGVKYQLRERAARE